MDELGVFTRRLGGTGPGGVAGVEGARRIATGGGGGGGEIRKERLQVKRRTVGLISLLLLLITRGATQRGHGMP